jgi:hypothetical protein
MKIIPEKDAMLIEPESEFEEDWLKGFHLGAVFHKFGSSLDHYIGIKIKRKVEFKPLFWQD